MTIPQQPTGQAPAAPSTDPAGQALAHPTNTPAAAPSSTPPWERDGAPFDAARAWSLVENLRAQLAARPTGQAPAPAAPAAPTAPPPATPATSDPVAAQVEALRVQLDRERAARRHGLDDALVELLGTGTAEQIEARAKTLAERLTAPAAPGSPVPRRPVETLRPSTGDPTAAPEETDPAKLADRIRSRSIY